MGMQALPIAIPPGSAQREQGKTHSSQLLPEMGLTAYFPSYCPKGQKIRRSVSGTEARDQKYVSCYIGATNTYNFQM